jgi:predicted small integral membrane protein
MLLIRALQISFVAYVGLFALLASVSNAIDYSSNFVFLQHVLTMDTTFPESPLRSRAIHDPDLHRLAYILIILVEAVTGLVCLLGAARLKRKWNADAVLFHRAKGMAVFGLGLGFTLWYLGFMVIGGEWFAMWQSPHWNAQAAAMRPVLCIGIVIIVLLQKE